MFGTGHIVSSIVSIGIVMVQQLHHHRVLQVFAVVVFPLGSQIYDNKAELSLPYIYIVHRSHMSCLYMPIVFINILA